MKAPGKPDRFYFDPGWGRIRIARPVGTQLRLRCSNHQAKADVDDFERSPRMGVPISLLMLLMEQLAKICPEWHRKLVGLAGVPEVQSPLRARQLGAKSFVLKFCS
jgi:hypothetical protein